MIKKMIKKRKMNRRIKKQEDKKGTIKISQKRKIKQNSTCIQETVVS